MADSSRFDPEIAERVLPHPLLDALRHVFAQGIDDCMLVGGTALAGFYAGHRRSDDLDLFTGTATAFRQAVLAVRSLATLRTEMHERSHSNQFYRAVCSSREWHFTVDVVLDPHALDVGGTNLAGDVMVADLPTLLSMKAATLVSRCSEKDLYDLLWLFGAFPDRHFADLIELGHEFDGGVNGEALLYSIGSAGLEQEACGFASDFGTPAAAVFTGIKALRRELLVALDRHLTAQTQDTLGDVMRRIRTL